MTPDSPQGTARPPQCQSLIGDECSVEHSLGGRRGQPGSAGIYAVLDPGVALVIFIASYMLMPYRPMGLPLSPSTAALGFGFLTLTVHHWRHGLFGLPGKLELTWLVIMAGTALTSLTIIHAGNSGHEVSIAYILSLLTFAYVRIAAPSLSRRHLKAAVIAYGILTGLLCLLQAHFGTIFAPAISLAGHGGNSMVYTIAFTTSPNHSAALALPVAAIAIWALVSPAPDEFHPWWYRLTLIGATATIALSLSRAGTLAWLALLTFSIFTAGRGLRWPAFRTVMLASLAYLTANLAMAGTTLEHYRVIKWDFLQFSDAEVGMFRGGEFNPDNSMATRFQTAEVAVEALREHPLWGLGAGRFAEFYALRWETMESSERAKIDPRARMTPHNAALEWATELGLVPTAALGALLAFYGRQLRRRSDDHFPWSLACGILALGVWMMFHDTMHDRPFWIYLGLLGGIVLPTRLQTAMHGHCTYGEQERIAQ